MLDRFKNSWNLIAQVGVWVMGIVTGFVLTPQMGGPQDEQSIWNLTQFVINILIGLMFLLTIKAKKKAHLKYWVAATLLTLSIGLVAYFSYMNQRGNCSCRYYSKTVLIGTTLLEARESNRPCEELLKIHAGDVSEIWTRPSINRCRTILAISYISTVPMFALSLICVVQSFYIGTGRRR